MNKFAHLDIQQIHDLNGMAILAIDTDGIITYANTAAGDLLCREHVDLVGQSLFRLFGGGSPEQAFQKEILAGKSISNQELVVRNPLGEERWLMLSSHVIVDANDLVQTYLFIQDISTLKKRESVQDESGQTTSASHIARDFFDSRSLKKKCSVIPVTWRY